VKLLYLHGAPAVGKLTVARLVLSMVPGRLLDNHAAIDFARTLFDFGAPGFWGLVHEVRNDALAAAARQDISLLVMTACYSHPEDLPMFEEAEDTIQAAGTGDFKLLPVFLHCAQVTAERRVGAAERIARRKLSTVDGLRSFVGRNDFAPLPRSRCMHVDTTRAQAGNVARRIVDEFGLRSLLDAQQAQPPAI
jgi:hypothetical protein